MDTGIKKGVFISFSSEDKDLLSELEERFSNSGIVYPIIITARREVGNSNAGKVIKGIKEGEVFLPILTKKSIKAQWMNQEIGYARAINKPMFPLIERSVFKSLKGFIHKEDDQPYVFERNIFPNFCQCLSNAIEDIEKRYTLYFHELTNKELEYIKRGWLFKYNNSGAFLMVDGVAHPILNKPTFVEIHQILRSGIKIIERKGNFKKGIPIGIR